MDILVPKIPKGLGNFKNALHLIWKHLGLPPPTKRQLEIADWLQDGPDRQITEAFRGIGKSWITAAYVDWELLMDSGQNILVVSASAGKADEFSIFAKRLILEIPWLQHLKPTDDQRRSNVNWDVGPAGISQAPSVKSLGVTGQLTGSRADIIIPDDIESSINSMTPVQREKILHQVGEFESILKPSGQIKYLGTPHTEESLYLELENRGYQTRIWPARFPGEKLLNHYGERLSPVIRQEVEEDPSIEGDPTDPERFPEEDLIEREAAKGRSAFALQFMLDTSLSDANRYPLKLSDLIVMDLDTQVGPEKVVYGSGPKQLITDIPCPGFKTDRWYAPMQVVGEMVPWEGSLLTIDPSGTGSDELAWNVTKMLNGQIGLIDWGGFMHGYAEATLEALALKAKEHKVNYLITEANFGDGMFTKLLTPWLQKHHPVTVEDMKHSTQKERRIIDTLEPVMNSHKLIVNRGAIHRDLEGVSTALAPEERLFYTLFHQMTRVTKERGCLYHDDRLDALSMAVAYWIDHLGTDADDKMAQRAREAWDRELDEIYDRANRPKGTWLSGTLPWV